MAIADALAARVRSRDDDDAQAARARARGQVRLEAAREVVLARRARDARGQPAVWGARRSTSRRSTLAGSRTAPRGVDSAELLATFDKNVAATRAALTGKTDAELMAAVDAASDDGQTLFTMPKAVVWRSFVLNHLMHHRGQLSVYLRLLDVPRAVDVRAERRREPVRLGNIQDRRA